MGHPIQFLFGSRVGFSGSADRMALFPVGPNSIWECKRKQCARSNYIGISCHFCISGWTT